MGGHSAGGSRNGTRVLLSRKGGRLEIWARLGSNQRPLPCEGSALPLSYAPCAPIIGRQNTGVESLRGKLLIASPALPDWFRRTVILIVEHTEEGAFGLVLNRRSETTVADAVPVLEGLAGPDEPVHIGGPVQQEGVVALGEFPDPGLSPKPVVGDVGLVDLDHPPEGLERVRVFAGHAGWGEGQLDGELEAEAWIVAEAEPGDAFSDGDLWADALRRQGGEYELLARMPADPSMN